MLNASDLADAIISAMDSAVQAAGGQENFNPDAYDGTVYLDAIYDYIKQNAEVQASYVGMTTTTPPVTDPVSGPKTFKLAKVSNPGLKQSVIASQKAVAAYPPVAWWTTLINSILMITETDDTAHLVTSSPGTALASQVPYPVSGSGDYKANWKSIATAIVTAVQTAIFTVPTGASVTKSPGAGMTTFIKIN